MRGEQFTELGSPSRWFRDTFPHVIEPFTMSILQVPENHRYLA
jgi:hypothetical protein